MELATISSNGQITVPADVRKALGLAPGDKVAFVRNELGDITVVKPSDAALIQAQRAFAGGAEQAGLHSPDDVDQLTAKIRAERRQQTP